AATMGVELIRFDMSEYMERHTVSRLIGAPPGYVGFDQGGLLTDGVDQHPHCVLLLDEVEKAHPDLFNVLLQIMDHGKLTDHNGKQVDFRNVILIMTTNAGAADLARQAYGFTRIKREGDDLEAINRMFAPEFRNRLDAIITFAHLTPEIIAKVVEKFVLQLEAQLGDRDVTIELSEDASKWLVTHGYDEQMGARPMARLRAEGAAGEGLAKLGVCAAAGAISPGSYAIRTRCASVMSAVLGRITASLCMRQSSLAPKATKGMDDADSPAMPSGTVAKGTVQTASMSL